MFCHSLSVGKIASINLLPLLSLSNFSSGLLYLFAKKAKGPSSKNVLQNIASYNCPSYSQVKYGTKKSCYMQITNIE